MVGGRAWEMVPDVVGFLIGGRSRTAAAEGSRAGARARLRRLRAALVLLLAALLRGLRDPVAVEGLALLRRVLLPAAVVLARAVAAVPIGDLVLVLVFVRLLVALVGLVGGARGLARPAPVVVLLREAAVRRRVAAVALDLRAAGCARAGDLESSAECSMAKKRNNTTPSTNAGICLRNAASKRVPRCTSAFVVASARQKIRLWAKAGSLALAATGLNR